MNNLHRISKVLMMIIVLFTSCKPQHEMSYKAQGKINYEFPTADETMLDSIQQKTFQFFMHEKQPEWGIVKDRTAAWAPASIASTGFGIPAFAIGAERKWISREEAAKITLSIIQFFAGSKQSADTNATGYKGFYYHFLRMNSGTREWKCELSTIDSGILMMGIIFARNYYNLNNETEKKIRELAEMLLGRMEWDFIMMPDTGKHANCISMGWTPDKGVHDFGWSGYNEGLLLYVLAAGTGLQDAE
ncbi:MAG TPA: hypothetical protein PLP88_01865, partial [Bacteroidales bacterium]|nr:hypothetical protein [Bacteroidales bacterium]